MNFGGRNYDPTQNNQMIFTKRNKNQSNNKNKF